MGDHSLSARIQWNSPSNALSKRLHEKRQEKDRILDLTLSNPTLAGIQYDHEVICRALSPIKGLAYEPDPKGSLSARKSICRFYLDRWNTSIQPERIVLTSSTSEAYSFLFKMLANPGDEILVPQPGYPLFEHLAALESTVLNHYPLIYDGEWHIDFQALEEKISIRTRALVIIHPNNPTGSFLKGDECLKLLSLCERHRLPLICDEVFLSYNWNLAPGSVTTLAGRAAPLIFVLNGLSKLIGLPQLKLGWILVDGDSSMVEQAVPALEIVADAFLSVGTLVQHGVPELLGTHETISRTITERVMENFQKLNELVGTSGMSECSCLNVEGGWNSILKIPALQTDEGWALDLLNHENVLVHPGYFYHFTREGHLVLSLLTPPADFKEGITRILSFISSKCRMASS